MFLNITARIRSIYDKKLCYFNKLEEFIEYGVRNLKIRK
jgi:hypothetical protein